MNEITYEKKAIKDKINEYLGGNKVIDIIFRIKQ